MKKEKIVNCVYYLAFFIGIACLIWGSIKVDSTILIIAFALLFLVFLPLDRYKSKIKNEKNPLSFDKISTALSFCCEKKHGSKLEFISQYGEDMYNHFTSKGFIHELLDKENGKWELTKLGLRIKAKYFS